MPFVVACPTCHQALTVHESAAGQSVACPHCRCPLTVPTVDVPPSAQEADPFALPTKPRTKRRSSSGNGKGLLLIVSAACILLGCGFALYIAIGPGRSKPVDTAGKQGVAAASVEKGTKLPLPKPIVAQPATKPKAAEPPNRDWKLEAKIEYQEALEERERRMKSIAQRVGAMSQGELVSATRCLKAYQDNGGNAPPDIEAEAAKLAPDYVAAMRRERLIASLNYEELVRLGSTPRYHSKSKRMDLYPVFASAVRIPTEWRAVHKFNELTASEIDELMVTVSRLKDGGLEKLTTEERRQLLRAGALDYFAAELGL